MLFLVILQVSLYEKARGMNMLRIATVEDDAHDLEALRTHLNRYEKEKEQCFDDVVLTFHTFRPEQAFLIAAEKIQKIQKCDYTDEVIDFKKSETLSDDNIVGLLSGYSYSSHI